MTAADWAEVLEDHARDGRPLTEAKLLNLAAFLRDVPDRIERIERLVDDLRERVV
jgi:hypothetical protein